MHEISLIESIIDIVTKEMSKHNITKVNIIKLKIGEMSHVVPEALYFSFETMTKGTPLEFGRLIIEIVSTKGRCTKCKTEFVMNDILALCPKCEDMNIEIISGKELEISEFEGI